MGVGRDDWCCVRSDNSCHLSAEGLEVEASKLEELSKFNVRHDLQYRSLDASRASEILDAPDYGHKNESRQT